MDTVQRLLQEDDPALVYQVQRDLLDKREGELLWLRGEIARRGQGGLLLAHRGPDGHWGRDVYGPKWTCTHYVLYELLQLGIPPDNSACRESAALLLGYPRGAAGGINYAKTVEYSDVCINGMILGICSYFHLGEAALEPVVDYLLETQMADGGWNCEYLGGARHSSLHTSIAVLEGIHEYLAAGGRRRAAELGAARERGIEFILRHELFKSETTGERIKDEFFRLAFPVRWKYDILRCLDHFRRDGVPLGGRMKDALDALEAARAPDGFWRERSQPGKTYPGAMAGGAGRAWNTLRALRVLRRYGRTGSFAGEGKADDGA